MIVGYNRADALSWLDRGAVTATRSDPRSHWTERRTPVPRTQRPVVCPILQWDVPYTPFRDSLNSKLQTGNWALGTHNLSGECHRLAAFLMRF